MSQRVISWRRKCLPPPPNSSSHAQLGILLNRVVLSFAAVAWPGRPPRTVRRVDARAAAVVENSQHRAAHLAHPLRASSSSPQWPLVPRVLLEWLLIVLPPLLSLTVCADAAAAIVLVQLALALALHAASSALWSAPLFSLDARAEPQHALWRLLGESQRSFISNFRSGMMLLTCIAILAVDFRVFPRRHAKTEDAGVSLVRRRRRCCERARDSTAPAWRTLPCCSPLRLTPSLSSADGHGRGGVCVFCGAGVAPDAAAVQLAGVRVEWRRGWRAAGAGG